VLPSRARLRKSRDFQAVYRTRKSWGTPCLSLHVRWGRVGEAADAGDVPSIRFGFVISKKVAKRAHVRNKLKRRMREISRRDLLPHLRVERGADLLFVARPAAPALGFAALRHEMQGLMRQGGLLMETAPAPPVAFSESAR